MKFLKSVTNVYKLNTYHNSYFYTRKAEHLPCFSRIASIYHINIFFKIL